MATAVSLLASFVLGVFALGSAYLAADEPDSSSGYALSGFFMLVLALAVATAA